MFGKLKAAAGDAANNKAATLITAHVEPVMEEIQGLSPTIIMEDDTYQSHVIEPTLVALQAASSGVTSMVPNFDEKFGTCMFHLRSELLELSEDKVELIADFKQQLPTAVMEGLKL
ncbi:hypothetical protein BTO01_13820 [Vibrio jasicida]|uniref:hypothetical protein n=1 Tax=Vibrio jasicida TaxID=766224 RepID=UPI0006D26FA8|nr:hypothetical protein [Vibrio jasicida]PQJ65442.1 hypothetical protein BTO01_13820 [Vibrio jasicida]CAH1608032.1 conserved hypothetical protein [Vibrio jasicida]